MGSIMDLLQIGGGVVLCAGYVPQIRRIITTRSAHDLSLSMWLSVLVGLIAMEIYAVHLLLTTGTVAVLLTNTVSLLFSVAMVSLILTYGTRPAGMRLLAQRAARAVYALHADSAPAAGFAEVEQAA